MGLLKDKISDEYNDFEINTNINPVHHVPVIKIILEDDILLSFIKHELNEKGWVVITDTNPEIMIKQYFETIPDCLILDLKFINHSESRKLEHIWKYNLQYFIPNIVINDENDKEARYKAYQAGAADFFTIPLDTEEFVIKIEHHLERKKMIVQSVLIDNLTQVYNRKFYDTYMPSFFKDYKRTKQAFSIAILNFDHLKEVNESFGRAMGDMALREFATYIKNHIRSTDYLFRYDNEEFVCVFPKTTSLGVSKKLSKLIQEFSEITFYHKGQPFSVTISAGVFMVNNESVTQEQAFNQARLALNKAKSNGGARVETAMSQKKKLLVSIIDDDMVIRLMLSQLLQSIKIDNFDLEFQLFECGLDFFKTEWETIDHPHILIVDGVMPVMDGIEVLQKVKSGKNASNYSVLMLSSRKCKDYLVRALSLGAADYVTKPFSITELKARIERLIKQVK